MPNSGVLVLPRTTRPARRSRCTNSEVKVETLPRRNPEPSVNGVPSISTTRSLSRYGTPANGPDGGEAATAARAWSNSGVTTAFRTGFSRSIRSIAASTSSVAVTSPLRTSAAWSVASSNAISADVLVIAHLRSGRGSSRRAGTSRSTIPAAADFTVR